MPEQIEAQRGTAHRGGTGRFVREDTALEDRIASLERENAQLRQALHTRIVIEQAKGILAERLRLDLDRAFDVLRRAARSERRLIHELATEITTDRNLPACIEAQLRPRRGERA